jgi:hypothetical protein
VFSQAGKRRRGRLLCALLFAWHAASAHAASDEKASDVLRLKCSSNMQAMGFNLSPEAEQVQQQPSQTFVIDLKQKTIDFDDWSPMNITVSDSAINGEKLERSVRTSFHLDRYSGVYKREENFPENSLEFWGECEPVGDKKF